MLTSDDCQGCRRIDQGCELVSCCRALVGVLEQFAPRSHRCTNRNADWLNQFGVHGRRIGRFRSGPTHKGVRSRSPLWHTRIQIS